ncbi:arylsulfatase A-like enzyme [Lewinella marina]|uniref:Arylsulfatase n=1 Tax=Neolewinella marina TaxID=438751 RepID=A0A2G0CGL9_9BACT|nr:sulfatase [Neolewinella marina]NJB86470.1 arylsulfatase A-like enzyme [Neolewinella marina]PHK99070.1 arylsulfatase [Neolewinella marina]
MRFLVFLAMLLFMPRWTAAQDSRSPNIIVIFADDLGYGDLESYGHPTIRTPRLDEMGREGQRWTSFYVAANVCTPSRAALLTGRYPVRSGMASDHHRVLFPNSTGGLPATEITLAEQLKSAGYATAAIGKWHLGHLPKYLPTAHGFDTYFGIPYSNDMDMSSHLPYHQFWQQPHDSIRSENFNVPLLRDTTVVERPADQRTITRRYTQEAMDFIKRQGDNPFFIYLAHNLPHVPLFASDDFLGSSHRGLYGDVIEEIDHGVGQILDLLRTEGLAENTIVVFTSDNGPWLSYGLDGGSAGPLYAGKGTTWEGGHRVPAIFWGPGRVAPATVRGIGSTLDFLPTFSALAGVAVPDDRPIDGIDLSVTLLTAAESPRREMIYYRGSRPYAVRLGDYKVHYVTQGAYGQFGEREEHAKPLLYHLGHDPGETTNIAELHPEVIQQITDHLSRHRATVKPAPDQLSERLN